MNFSEKNNRADIISEQIFRNNEAKTNQMASAAIITVSALMVVYSIAGMGNAIDGGYFWCLKHMLMFSIGAIIVCVVVKIVGYEKWWARYALIFSLIGICGLTHFLYATTVVFLIFGPIMISTRYYDRQFTIHVAIVTLIIHTVNVVFNTLFEHWFNSIHQLHVMNNAHIWSNTKSVILYMGVTKTAVIILTAFIGVVIADGGRRLVEDQINVTYTNVSMETELAAAANIQMHSMPEPNFTDPSGRMHIDAYINPARETGGDFYDYFMINENLMAVVVADVSDKGLGAAMFSMQALSAVRFALTSGSEPDLAKAAGLVNSQLVKNNREQMFITMWIACIDCRTGVGKYINAGHPGQLIKRKNGTVEEITSEPQLFMGFFDDVEYETGVVNIGDGEGLVLFTDGVTDARNSDDEEFGKGRLLKIVENSSERITDYIVDGVVTHINGAGQFDDITILTLTRTEGKQVETGKVADGLLHCDFTIERPAMDEYVTEIIDVVNSGIESVGCPDFARRNIGTVVDDILSNIITYAYDDDTAEPERLVELRCIAGANFARLQFSDNGIPFNPLDADKPDVDGEPQIGGMGIWLVRGLTDEMKYSYEDGKNILTVTVVWNV